MTIEKQRIAIDQDEVIADYLAKAIAYYNKEYQQRITTANLVEHLQTNPAAGDLLYNYMDYEHFCRDLEVIKDSQKVVLDLSRKFEVLIVSAATLRPKTMVDKLEWIRTYFSFIPRENIIFCGSKRFIHADYLIDDSITNVKTFKGQGLLFTNPYNQEHTEITRVNSWEEIAKLLL